MPLSCKQHPTATDSFVRKAGTLGRFWASRSKEARSTTPRFCRRWNPAACLAALFVVVEVKNMRQWIYPRARELYQLLYKAARLQARSGDVDVVPVLIARHRHYLTYQHARALGFVAFETAKQFIHPGAPIASAKLQEVRAELGFVDLVATNKPDAQLLRRIEQTLPTYGRDIGRQWREGGSQFVDEYDVLRGPLSDPERSAAMAELKRNVWRRPD